ncbi:hypothetical protein [Geitlerinema sp. PCC 9228]|uniref:hypothetical protein n=1 Tax=Geitlerinema sp. PCC 9228 TaxID=111611 RepID=UPI0008F9B89B|nr:hypothetical protein [Geitlerinema sp. PCC 9228]
MYQPSHFPQNQTSPTPAKSAESPQTDPEAIAKLERKHAYQRRLLQLWMHHIKETGEIDHAPLADHLEQVFQVETATPNTLLLPAEVAQLQEKLESSRQLIADATHTMQDILADLQATHGDGMLNPNRQQEYQQAFSPLCQGIEQILEISQHHLQGDTTQDPISQEIAYKLHNDLTYFRQYLLERACLSSLLHQNPSPATHQFYRRLQTYLSNIDRSSERFVCFLQAILQDKDVSRRDVQNQSPTETRSS